MVEETRHYQVGQAPTAQAAAVAVTEQAVPVELAPGTAVGEYWVVRKLGAGGMGAVYAGEQPAIGKRVAIKVLAPHFAADVELVRRFLDEARAVNLIHHPNIIDIFSFGELPGPRPYFVMEYLDGESLADAIEHQHLRADEIGRLLRQICGALEATHKMGIVHRDLKPENIWIARPAHAESYVKLLDFGIAKLVDPTRTNLTQTGAVLGTPLYMSPEQCLGREVGVQADIYALGVLLYRIFTGRYPFMGTVTTELAIKHVTEPPPPPSQLRSLPPALEKLILDCLTKDPAARPASASVLGARLGEVLSAWPEHGMATANGQVGWVAAAAPVLIAPQPSRQGGPTLAARTKTGMQRGRLWLGIGVLIAVAIGAAFFLRHMPTPTARPVGAAPPALPRAGVEPAAVEPEARPVAPSEQHRQLEARSPSSPRPSGKMRTVGRVAGHSRLDPAAVSPHASIPNAGQAKEPEAASKPTSSEVPAPPPRPSRAQEHGLLDENPLRR